jgi:two-component system, chemotaxis family, chemotaxis protein CheY
MKAPAGTAARAEGSKEMPKKILLVDDSIIPLTLHALILGEAGYVCSQALNGYLALEMLLKERFDMIITDVNMPRVDGYELTRTVRSTPGYESVPIIMVTTESESGDRQRGMEAGANVYLVKPTPPQVLLTQVAMLLAMG